MLLLHERFDASQASFQFIDPFRTSLRRLPGRLRVGKDARNPMIGTIETRRGTVAFDFPFTAHIASLSLAR